jgi:hypothetical protein
VPHQRDRFQRVAAGTTHYEAEEMITAGGPGDRLFGVRRWDYRRDGLGKMSPPSSIARF